MVLVSRLLLEIEVLINSDMPANAAQKAASSDRPPYVAIIVKFYF